MQFNVIGNGTSRKQIDLTKLEGRTFACNAAYRDFMPDDLVFIDAKMSAEIFQANLTCRVWTRSNYVRTDWLRLPEVFLSAGTSALNLASSFKPKIIHMYGMDMTGSNIYANTYNYRSSAKAQTNTSPWINEMQGIIKHNPEIKYIRFKTLDCPEFDFGANYEERLL